MFGTGKLEASLARDKQKRVPSGPSESVRPAQIPERTVLDVRTSEEFAAAHVPNAKNIPVQELLARHAELGAKTTPVVIYCRSGARSATAANLLKGLGYSRVTDIGLMSNWRED
jgi:rhodanese-related sulfurtransferase